ncbi:Histidine kinase [Chitinophaga jiangningensis]|uniref:Histidine kinase n=1 Tax=Chitinophaga jiangningensis TaxID=1419482 RepID=A0A1M7CYP3_9BACT|nr:histidine kinase [Chitinophaga jiangningensis]SHL72223.1 Histidine kinase [Chitinophaga jiangningensis]
MNQQQLRKIEFGVATGIFLLALFSLLGPSFMGDGHIDFRDGFRGKFDRYHQVFDYYLHVVLPLMTKITFVYLFFVYLNFLVVPKFLEKERWITGGLLVLAGVIPLFLALMVANSYRYGYMLGQYQTIRGAHTQFAKMAFLSTIVFVILYVFYYAIKTAYAQYLHRWVIEKILPNKAAREIGVGTILWLATVIITYGNVRYTIFFFGPVMLTIYYFTLYRIFPEFQAGGRKPKLWRDLVILVLLANTVMVIVTAVVLHHIGDMAVILGLLSALVSVVATIPVCWLLFRSRLEQQSTVIGLQKALGRSAADLDFLRTQINPHFLFNALNTLYGTALQEQATRTSEGIQKLGDMMRFMLHDNTLEKIPLDKEVAYLQNYIDLQRLRVMQSPDIKIEVNIDETNCHHEIAPMLLIPFVENAFKHGISLRNRSSIVISLSCNDGEIFFDVYNSVHPKPENDPERNSLGIGLNNVKERLALLYPGSHELSIRQTATGFFVHLTISVKTHTTQ